MKIMHHKPLLIGSFINIKHLLFSEKRIYVRIYGQDTENESKNGGGIFAYISLGKG